MKNKIRSSGVEILKIISMFLICLSHTVQSLDLIDFSSLPHYQIIILGLIEHFGMIGNTIFVICSAWFLLESDKINCGKIISILLDSTIISIGCFVGMILHDFEFSREITIKQFLPDLFSQVWFVPFYISLYLIHPILNAGIKKIKKPTYLLFLFSFILIFVITSMFIEITLINDLVSGILIYFVVGFFKKYCPSFNKKKWLNYIVFLSGLTLYFILAISKFYLSDVFEWIGDKPNIYGNFSFLLLIPLICLFNIFNSHTKTLRFINALSSCTLFVYCLHENYLLRGWARPLILKELNDIHGLTLLFPITLLFSCILFVSCFEFCYVYKISIHKLTSLIGDLFNKWYAHFSKTVNKKENDKKLNN